MMPKQRMNGTIKNEWSKQCIAMDRYIAIATVLTTVPRKENEIKNTHQSRTLKLSSVIYGTDCILKLRMPPVQSILQFLSKRKISTSKCGNI